MKNVMEFDKDQWRDWLKGRLKEFRNSKGMTHQGVAEYLTKFYKMRFKLSRYSSYEEGRAEPSISTIKHLCLLYEKTMDEFFEGCPICPEHINFQ